MSFPDPKPPILKNRAYFSVEPFVLNGVNARGSSVIRPPHEKSVTAFSHIKSICVFKSLQPNKKVSKYDQEIPQLNTADQPTAP